MKKVLIIISIVIASLAILVIAGLKIAPMVARSYIVGNSEDLIGRKVAIESISLNPFNFTLEIDSLAVYEKDGETPFVSFDKFRVNVDPLRMFTGTVAVSEIYLKGLYTRVLQHGDRFNFTDIIEFLAKGDTASVDSAAIVADSAAADSAGMVNAAEIAEGLPFNISVENIVFEKGNIIYHEGDVCENIGIVISGKIDIVSYSFEGKEQLINTLKAGEIFGNNLLFSSEPLYRGDVVAKEKSVVAFINKENLVFLLQNNAEFLNLYLKAQSDKAKALTARIQLLSFTNAEERLFYYASKNDGVINFKNVTSLAATIGVQRETLSRLLTNLIERHLIKKEKGKITVIKKKRR